MSKRFIPKNSFPAINDFLAKAGGLENWAGKKHVSLD
jgi:hypothetical protein